MNVAYNVDCMEYMRTLPDKAFDLAVVDPPYEIERFKHGGSVINKYGDETRKWNNKKPTKEYFEQLFRVSKKQIIWGANNFNLPTSEYFIIWDKVNPPDFSFAQCEMAWTNCKVPAKIFRYNSQKESSCRIHPTQKPVALYAWIFSRYAKPEDKILDTHLGSGSSRIAAYNAGLDFVGCEIDPDYFKAQEERFKEHTAQENLFLQREMLEGME